MKKNGVIALSIFILSAVSGRAQIDHSKMGNGVFPDSTIAASIQLHHNKLTSSLASINESYYCIAHYSIGLDNDLIRLEILEDSLRPMPAQLASHLQKLIEIATNELSSSKKELFIAGKHALMIEFRKKEQTFENYFENIKHAPWFGLINIPENPIYAPGAGKWLILYY